MNSLKAIEEDTDEFEEYLDELDKLMDKKEYNIRNFFKKEGLNNKQIEIYMHLFFQKRGEYLNKLHPGY